MKKLSILLVMAVVLLQAFAAPVARAEERPAAKAGDQKWVDMGKTGDWSGSDTDCTGGAVPDPSLCTPDKNGTVAVCWNGRKRGHPFDKCRKFTTWCTYKNVKASSTPSGAAPGRVYECVAPPKQVPVITFKIEGQDTIKWGTKNKYTITVFEKGQKKNWFPKVKWSLKKGTVNAAFDKKSRSREVTVTIGPAPGEFSTQTIRVRAQVEMTYRGKTLKKKLSKKVRVTNASQSCKALQKDLDQILAEKARIQERLRNLKDRLHSMEAPNLSAEETFDREISDLMTKIDEAQTAVKDATSANDAAQTLVDSYKSAHQALMELRDRTWRNLPEKARLTAAKERYEASQKTNRDKLAYIQTIRGMRNTNTKRPSGSGLDVEFEEARLEYRRKINVPVGAAIVNLGDLAMIAMPSKGGKGGRVAKALIKAIKSYKKLKKAFTKHKAINELSKSPPLNPAALRQFQQHAGEITKLIAEYQNIISRDPDSPRLSDIKRRIWIQMKAMHNLAIDGVHRNEVSLKIAKKLARETKTDLKKAESRLKTATKTLKQKERDTEDLYNNNLDLLNNRRMVERKISAADEKLAAVAAKFDRSKAEYSRLCGKNAQPQ